jgi:GNAT superfamily N-acetyltransferase
MVTLRPVRLPDDSAALLALDSSFSTDRVYRVACTPHSFALEEVPVWPAVHKAFALTEADAAELVGEDRAWDQGVVAEQEGAIVGFAAWKHQRWNHRAEIWHLYVAPAQRGHGVGRALVEAAATAAREAGMRTLWVETNTLAYPAIQFYRHFGFSLCGLDTSLYDPAAVAADETALFFSRPL